MRRTLSNFEHFELVRECLHSGFGAKDVGVVVITGAVRHTRLQSNRHHQQTNTQLLEGCMPFLSPNQQCHGTEEKTSHIFHGLAHPQLTRGSSNIAFDH